MALNFPNFPNVGDQYTPAGQSQTYEWDGVKWVLLAPAGMGDLIDDKSPQLGGDLDVNGFKVVSTSNGNIDIEPDGTGDVLLGTLQFDADQAVGAPQAGFVLTYNNATGKIELQPAPGAGGGNAWSDPVDADIIPDADGTRDLGSAANRFAELNVDAIPVNGAGNVVLGNYLMAGDQTLGVGVDNFVLTYDNATGRISLEAPTGGAGEPSDGDKGDIAVTGSGLVWTIKDGVVTNAKRADMPAWTLSGRNNAATGAPEDITLAAVTEEPTPGAGFKLFGWDAGAKLATTDVDNLPFIGNVVEDTTPQLGGPLGTMDQNIEYRTAGDALIGLTGLTATDDGVFLVYAPGGIYDPLDGGLLVDAGGIELHGSVVNAPSLSAPMGETHQLYVDEVGNLFPVAPPDNGWAGGPESDTSAAQIDLGTGTDTPAWTHITDLIITIPAEGVSLGELLNVYTRLYVTNKTTNRTGNIEIGFGIDGADPGAGASSLRPISAGFAGTVSANISTSNVTLTSGQTVSVFARRANGSHASYGLDLDGTVSLHELIVTLDAGSGGGSGEINTGSNVGVSADVDLVDGPNVLQAIPIRGLKALSSRILITLNAGDKNAEFEVPAASEDVQGAVELAEQAEVDAGLDDTRAITPAKLAAWPGANSWSDFVDSNIFPDTTNAYDLGANTARFKDLWLAGTATVGSALAVSGNIDTSVGQILEQGARVYSPNNPQTAPLTVHAIGLVNPTQGATRGGAIAPQAGTVTKVSCYVAGTITTADVMVKKATARNGAATNILTSNLQGTVTIASTTSFADASLAAGDILLFDVVGLSGPAAVDDEVVVQVEVQY